ncbi:hypothetical protein NPIL_553391 [Nephila pilipes]|uniref:Uncharacterized protein n=1 Tax=Nephila pilipes TaxID=299642 RepID=A0A8X6NW67_NEPPI|nr:hypothetical protein NPIL_553391 [Nephila pilipes]
MRLLCVDGLSGLHGASPLSPAGASEKRSSSSAYGNFDGFSSLLVSCFRLLKSRILPCRVLSSPAVELSCCDDVDCVLFAFCVDFLKLQISSWGLVVLNIIFHFYIPRCYFSAMILCT